MEEPLLRGSVEHRTEEGREQGLERNQRKGPREKQSVGLSSQVKRPRKWKSGAIPTSRQTGNLDHLQRSSRGSTPKLSWQNMIGEKLLHRVRCANRHDGSSQMSNQSPPGNWTRRWAMRRAVFPGTKRPTYKVLEVLLGTHPQYSTWVAFGILDNSHF